jgi:hypothetical protein
MAPIGIDDLLTMALTAGDLAKTVKVLVAMVCLAALAAGRAMREASLKDIIINSQQRLGE